MKKQNGFTLIELLIVVAIIGIIAAIAIPNLLRSRMSANETAAIGACKTIIGAEVDWYNNTNPHSFSGSMEKLSTGEGAGGVGFMDTALGSGLKSGYTFRLVRGAEFPPGEFHAWSACAWPVAFKSTGVRSFYCDESGIVRGQDIGGTQGIIEMRSLD